MSNLLYVNGTTPLFLPAYGLNQIYTNKLEDPPLAILDKGVLYELDDGVLYYNGSPISGPTRAGIFDITSYTGDAQLVQIDLTNKLSALPKASFFSAGQIYFENAVPAVVALTLNTPAIMNVNTTLISNSGFDMPSNGELRYIGDFARTAYINYSCTVKNNAAATDDFRYELRKNGVLVPGSQMYFTSDNFYRNIVATCLVSSLISDDILSVYVTNITSNSDVAIYNVSLTCQVLS